MALLSMPCVLFQGVLKWEDFAVSQIWLPVGALAQGLFVVNGRIGWGWSAFRESVSEGSGPRMPDWMKWHYTLVIPVLVLIVMVAGLVRS